MNIWLIQESTKKDKAIIQTDSDHPEFIKDKNEEGFGVFWCLNAPNNKPTRRSEDVRDKDIKVWYVDIDNGDKRYNWKNILQAPLIPSAVVETGKGFHCYWRAKGATVANFSVIENNLIEHFHADPKARDLVRLLRVPGFLYNKTEERFLIEYIYNDSGSLYSEEEMLEAYKTMPKERVTTTEVAVKRSPHNIKKNSFFDDLKQHDQMSLLEIISGSSFVNGSTFSFVPTSGGKFNLLVNGRDHGFFINERGDIICPGNDARSNNLFNFLCWEGYGHSKIDVMDFVKKLIY